MDTDPVKQRMPEKRVIPKFHVAWFSIMRSTNDGPLKLMRMMLSFKHFTRHVEFWTLSLFGSYDHGLGSRIYTVKTDEVFLRHGLQFCSTILLTDITDLVIVADASRIQLPDPLTS
jgi:hypothetical protein